MKKKTKAPAAVNQKLEIISLYQFSKLAMTFWVGGTLTVGIVIIPLLFKTLDEITAAGLAGQILNINAYIGIVSLVLALLDVCFQARLSLLKSRKFWYIVTMESLLIVNYFAIFPIIVELRTKLADVANHVIQHTSEFSFWHSVSAIMFLIICILGTLYIVER
jgi:hypothetical protein